MVPSRPGIDSVPLPLHSSACSSFLLRPRTDRCRRRFPHFSKGRRFPRWSRQFSGFLVDALFPPLNRDARRRPCACPSPTFKVPRSTHVFAFFFFGTFAQPRCHPEAPHAGGLSKLVSDWMGMNVNLMMRRRRPRFSPVCNSFPPSPGPPRAPFFAGSSVSRWVMPFLTPI